MMKRRLFMFAAPAIVAAPSLMRVSVLKPSGLTAGPIIEALGSVPEFTYAPQIYTQYSGYEVLRFDWAEDLADIRRTIQQVTGIPDLLRGSPFPSPEG
jgi:hypothetical protein